MASTMREMGGLMAVVAFAIALTGCNDGASGDGAGTSARSSLNVGTGIISGRPVTGPPQANPPTAASALAISGTPATSVTVGSAYSFAPSVSATAGSKLSYAISNAPSWAHFDAGTGTLAGSPAAGDVGTDASITISVSNGTTTASLAPFSIAVAAAPTNSITLSWTPPTVNADGTAVSGLAGYHLYYGPSEDQMTSEISISGAADISQVVNGLTTGTWYFAVTSYNSMNVESKRSSVLTVTI